MLKKPIIKSKHILRKNERFDHEKATFSEKIFIFVDVKNGFAIMRSTNGKAM